MMDLSVPEPIAAAPDYDLARELMVDGQIRPNKVNDPRIINAMRVLRRELFVPPEQAPFAYIDEDLPVGNGRVLIEPMILARLIQTLRPMAGQRALVIGAGVGYGAAVLAACGPQVTALEEDEALAAIAHTALPQAAFDVASRITLVTGRLLDGWESAGPYDLIMIEGAVPELPACCAAQLRPGGRLVAVLAGVGNASQAVLAEPVPGGLRARPVFDCATPVLPPLRGRSAFVF